MGNKKIVIKDALVLCAITLIASLLLAVVYEITKGPIEKQEMIRKQEAYKTVFADAAEFSEAKDADLEEASGILAENGYDQSVINEVLEAVDENQEKLGYVMSITSKEGYGGDITFSLGIQNDGTVNGIEILSISETAGLGAKAAEDEFKNQFSGKKVEKFEYTKTGASTENQIDALSGATITTNALTNSVNAGICYFRALEEMGGKADE
jgi:electron transport complex protein RnfG